MGQLRREVDGCDQAAGKGIGQRDERRFKPPRRRQLPARCISESGQNTAQADAGPASARSDGESWRPGADAKDGGERAPSVEIAWLWQASSRMDEDVQKVATFLIKHGLDRYAAVLADEPNGLGASLETLSQADDAQLEQAGIPASPRARLLTALQAEVATAIASSAAAPSRPLSRASAPEDLPTRSSTSTPGRWGCLGRAPPGWSVVTPKSDGLASRVVQTADASIGGDGCDDDIDVQSESAAVAETALRAHPPPATSSTPTNPRRPTPRAQASRPTSAVSRPGSSSGLTERISCYQCYKQVPSKFAVVAEDAPGEAGSRQFCSEACKKRFEQSLQERQERERQLSELRASLLGGTEAGSLAEVAC
jgi:hypothetical protein